MMETADAITNGEIQASPLQNKKSLPCSYCRYKSVCGNYPPSNPRVYAADAAARIERIKKGGDEE